MGILIKQKYSFKELSGKIVFFITINVNKDGEFTAYYPENVIEFLDKRFIELEVGRGRKRGFLHSTSLGGIKKQINIDFKKALDVKVSKEYYVIKYKIKAASSFCVDKDNKIFPDGSFGDYNNGEIRWYEGKTKTSATERSFYGINAYAQIYLKKEFDTVEGKKATYESTGDNECEELGEQIGILSHWRCMEHDEWQDEDLEELLCTEQNAVFFNNLFFSICRTTMQVDLFSSPRELQKVIDKGQNLLSFGK